MNFKMERDPSAATGEHYDLAVVGGGIYGVCLALEAAQRGLRVLMVEKGDFGGGVSWNSLRILHGGLRYLQKMDLRRFYESVSERRWFLRHFPDLCGPLPCMMPLYGQGLRRAEVFQVALRINDALSFRRNREVAPENSLGRGRVISRERAAALFPLIDRGDLQGAAYWMDGQIRNSQRLFMEICRWATSSGAMLLNYVEAVGLESADGKIKALRALDRISGRELHFTTDLIVNAAGPWCAEVTRSMGDDKRDLFPATLAFNVLFARAPMAETAVAVTGKEAGAQTYFLHNESGYLLGGTYYAPVHKGDGAEIRTRELVNDYIRQVNRAVPGLDLRSDQVLRIYKGVLRARGEGEKEPADHPIIFDHGRKGGIKGLWTISGVKYTTARLVAEQTIQRVFPNARMLPVASERPSSADDACLAMGDEIEGISWPELVAAATRIKREEAVVQFSDLMLRRTAWALDPDVGTCVARRLGPELGYAKDEIEACCASIGRRLFAVERPAPRMTEVA